MEIFTDAFSKYMQHSCPKMCDNRDLLNLSKFIEKQVVLDKQSITSEGLTTSEGECVFEAWTKSTAILKSVNAIYDTVKKVHAYMSLGSHPVGRWEHPDAQGLAEAIFAPEANIDEIPEHTKQEFAQDSWKAFVDVVATLRSDHKTHAYAQAAKIVAARVEEMKKIMCAKGESTPWKDSLPESPGTSVKAQEFFRIERVADFMATDRNDFAAAIKSVDKAMPYLHMSCVGYSCF